MTVNFIMVAMDQVVNAAAHIRYMFGGGTKVPLVIRTPGGGGHQLGAQHSHSHENWFAHVPGLKVVAPGTPADAKGMLKSAIRDDNPVMFIENEGTYAVKGDVPDGEHLVPLDKNEVKRPGDDITICAHSRMLIVAMDAATELEKDGISAEVVDMRALRPLDMAPVVESVKKTSRLITLEEGWRSYGVGAEIASRVYEEAFDYLDAPVARIGAAEVPAPYNKRLEKKDGRPRGRERPNRSGDRRNRGRCWGGAEGGENGRAQRKGRETRRAPGPGSGSSHPARGPRRAGR